MVFGMSLATYTLIHVIISLIAIGSGLIVLFGMFNARRLDRLTALFLLTTVLTSVTGYGFPFVHVTPGDIVGAISLVLLAFAILARYPMHMAGRWRAIYVITAVVALYLNCFVLVVQSFLKVPALRLAPKGNEPAFLVAQLVLMALFIGARNPGGKWIPPRAENPGSRGLRLPSAASEITSGSLVKSFGNRLSRPDFPGFLFDL